MRIELGMLSLRRTLMTNQQGRWCIMKSNHFFPILLKRKITSRAKKVYILYEGIGIISQITYSASAIASLKDIQIQNIINDFSTDMNCQKVICVTNCHAHMPEPNDIDISVELARPKTDTNREDQTNAEISISAESLILKDISTPPTLTQAGMTVPKPIAKKASPKVKVNESFTSQPNNTIPEKQNNLTHDRAYFCNKTLEQYPMVVKSVIIMY